MNKKEIVVFSKKYFEYLKNVLIVILIIGLIVVGCIQFIELSANIIGVGWSAAILIISVVLIALGMIVKDDIDYDKKLEERNKK